MIKLEVEGYCHDCLDFTPDVTKPERLYLGEQEEGVLGDTIVRCKNKRRCEAIRRYLEQKLEDYC